MIDATKIDRDPDKSATAIGERSAKQKNGGEPGLDAPPPSVMVRLHNPQSGVQILVAEDKAARLITSGAYRKGALPA